MPIGLAGRATAGRLSGAGTTPGFRRVGLGDGVASADADGAADVVGAADSVGDGDAGADGVAGTDDDVAGEGLGAADPVAPAAPVADGSGEPTGAVVHPARTPAHTSALRAITEGLTSSG